MSAHTSPSHTLYFNQIGDYKKKWKVSNIFHVLFELSGYLWQENRQLSQKILIVWFLKMKYPNSQKSAAYGYV